MLKKRLGIEAIEKVSYLRDSYKIPSSTLIIPEGCKSIGVSAFWGCMKLKKVIIPESVEEIEDYAFAWCSNAIITLRKPRREFKEIREGAFRECRDVKEKIRN